jgi:hypothetical protein
VGGRGQQIGSRFRIQALLIRACRTHRCYFDPAPGAIGSHGSCGSTAGPDACEGHPRNHTQDAPVQRENCLLCPRRDSQRKASNENWRFAAYIHQTWHS